jgi:hypothetical protein
MGGTDRLNQFISLLNIQQIHVVPTNIVRVIFRNDNIRGMDGKALVKQ